MKELLIWREKDGVGYRYTEYPEPDSGEYSYPEATKTPKHSKHSMEWWKEHVFPQLQTEGFLITPMRDKK